MKILELTNYSAGICGVWQRVKQESLELSKKGHEVRVFSSFFEKGTNNIFPLREKIKKIKIFRFPTKKIGGESFMKWDFEQEAIKYNPDIIIAHSYRHLHTTKALKIAKKINAKIFLVTHAPFERSETRNFLSKIIVKIYDLFIGKRILRKFDKIIAISKWEIPYLLKLGLKKKNISYIPNGIPKEFFIQKKSPERNKILFLGRISPIKNLETLIRSINQVSNKHIIFEIVGPKEEKYFIDLKLLIEKENVKERIKFSPPIYNIKSKIRKIDSCKLFILPSKSEGMPQSLIEAMARKKIVLGSDIPSIRDLIKNDKTGYLFKFNSPRDLAKKIELALQNNKKNNYVKLQAQKSIKQFSWKNAINKLEKLF